MAEGNTLKGNVPRGKKKGGTRFPRYSLEDCTPWMQKLVSKTHTSALPRDVIYAGVVGAGSGTGDVKISALKQYDLLGGDSKGYTATDLAKKIASAPSEELRPLYQKAALRPPVFGDFFTTFQGDTVSLAKLRQRAAELGVHPDEADSCVDVYASTLVTAGLASRDGDKVTHTSPVAGGQAALEDPLGGLGSEAPEADPPSSEAELGQAKNLEPEVSGPPPRAIFNVNIALDSSLDTEKLAKQLEILKRYGAI